MTKPPCSMTDCARPVVAFGWCHMHWARWRRHGDPEVVLRQSIRGTLEERLARRTRRGASDECWQWIGSKTSDGYGRIYAAGKSAIVHRIAYELSTGPIPPGMQIDHVCRNRACVNPAHLEAVTQHENFRRRDAAMRERVPA